MKGACSIRKIYWGVSFLGYQIHLFSSMFLVVSHYENYQRKSRPLWLLEKSDGIIIKDSFSRMVMWNNDESKMVLLIYKKQNLREYLFINDKTSNSIPENYFHSIGYNSLWWFHMGQFRTPPLKSKKETISNAIFCNHDHL